MADVVVGKVYCLTESFIARCLPREIIIVESATFGRMQIGRCVAKNYGHLGSLGVSVRAEPGCRTTVIWAVTKRVLFFARPRPESAWKWYRSARTTTMLVGYGPATVDKLGCQMSNYGHHVSPVYGPVLQFSCLIDRGAQSASPDHF